MVYLVFHDHSQIVSYFHLKNHLHSKDVWTDLTARRGGCQQDGSSSPSSVLPTSRYLESLQQGSKGKSKITSKKLQNLPPSFHPAVIQNLCNEVQLHFFVAAKKNNQPQIQNHKNPSKSSSVLPIQNLCNEPKSSTCHLLHLHLVRCAAKFDPTQKAKEDLQAICSEDEINISIELLRADWFVRYILGR